MDAIIITGSVGRLWADELSDVDLLVGWLEIPPAEERSALIDVLKDAGTRHMVTDEFYEGYNIPLKHKDMFFSEGVVIDVHRMTTDALERLVNNISEPALPEKSESEELDVQFVDHREDRILYNNKRTCASLQQGIVVFDPDRQIALWRKRLESFADALRYGLSGALWSAIDTRTASQSVRIMALRDDACYPAWFIIRRVRDMLWLVSLLNQTHIPGIPFSGKWLASLNRPDALHQRICEILHATNSHERAEKWIRLVNDCGEFVKKSLPPLPEMKLSQKTAQLVAENAVRPLKNSANQLYQETCYLFLSLSLGSQNGLNCAIGEKRGEASKKKKWIRKK